MSDASPDFLDSDLLKDDADATHQRHALSEEVTELKTTRLPSIPPPLPLEVAAPRLPSIPPPLPPEALPTLDALPLDALAVDALPAPGLVPTFESLPTDDVAGPAVASPQRPSWIRAALDSAFSAPAAEANPQAPVSATTAGTAFAALGVIFALVALATGLRGAPAEPMAPAVAAALVLAHTVVALGAGAMSFAMLARAERLLVQAPGEER